jgi:YYY domain-containing protein
MTAPQAAPALLAWYAAVQLMAAVALPLVLRLCTGLPDRGYSLAKIAGILWVSLVLWLGTSYGLLRNDLGGTWLALLMVGVASVALGWRNLADAWAEYRPGSGKAGIWRYVLVVEALFLTSYLVWAMVRAYDPAADHTEQPMDLMFMNSIWSSPTFPPHDAWLAGYPISYYYLGYWLLTTAGRLAGQPPEVTYNVGQAAWFGLLLIGCFGVVTNMLAYGHDRSLTADRRLLTADQNVSARMSGSLGRSRRRGRGSTPILETSTHSAGEQLAVSSQHSAVSSQQSISAASMAGGLLAALAVGVTGNLQVILEWLYANGFPVAAIASLVDVHNFPENASQAGEWFVGYDWWWWRSSRVIEDLNLLGEHVEVIDEFPMFSYVLGDNHPHVLAMPVVLMVVNLAMNMLFVRHRFCTEGDRFLRDNVSAREVAPLVAERRWNVLAARTPGGYPGLVCYVVTLGALIFLNTWDYPPYWLLLVMCSALAAWLNQRGRALPMEAEGDQYPWWQATALFGGVLIGGTVVVYLPYFLTAQSQAGGLLPNLFNPTRLPQFLVMFGQFLPALAGLLLLAWPKDGLNVRYFVMVMAVVLGVPVAFLAISVLVASGTAWGESMLASTALPEGAASHLPFIVERWTSQPWTFVLTGVGLSLVIALLLETIRRPTLGDDLPARRQVMYLPSSRQVMDDVRLDRLFAMLLAALGIALVYAPEFVFLRDNFGTRMNTVFKFYYQGWLLMGLAAAYAIATAFRATRQVRLTTAARLLGVVSLALMAAGLLYPAAAVYSKTAGFRSENPTLDATAYISDDERRAAEWVRSNTMPQTLVLEGKGASYWATYNRMSTLTGRPTLLGWDGHEAQWRGQEYGEMAAGRVEALDAIYRDGSPEEIRSLLDKWQIDLVYVGPTEVEQYGITDARLQELAAAMDLVFESGSVRIFRRQ